MVKNPKTPVWKVCSRGHKYKGSRCTTCWKGKKTDSPNSKNS